MKLQIALAMTIALTVSSNLYAQQNFFEQIRDEVRQQSQQLIQEEFGRRPPPQQGVPQRSNSLPSESGQRSGGGGRFYNPGDGGFIIPGNGGGQNFQPNPGFQRPGQGGFPGQTIYPGQTYDPNGQVIYPGSNFAGSAASPGSPVMSQQYILIRCPQGSTGSIRYTLSSGGRNFVYSIYAGQEQRFPAGSGWTISYQEGPAIKKYRLEGGKVYSMKQKEGSKWQLFAIL